jgi:Fe-Mn family superoxide dismutase
MSAFKLPELPYPMDALAPTISKETLEYHYGKHHKAYVEKLNKLIPGTPYESMNLEEIMKQSKTGPIFNNAGQIWNHTFYWDCLTPASKPKKMSDALKAAIEKSFGSVETFQTEFQTKAAGHFGSGWAWLVKDKSGALSVQTTANAGNPMLDGFTPILVTDVWEHAYYIDYRNDRAKYLASLASLTNWEFASARFSG